MTTLLDGLPIWLLGGCITLSVLLVIEAGFRFGKYHCSFGEPETNAPVGTIVGSTLGLLAFMLAFTFGLAASRFEQRRVLVVEEANSIGTTFLRAGLLPEEQVPKVRGLLAEYVDSRLEVVETGKVEQALSRADQLHRQLWAEAELAGRALPNSVAVGLFIQALNETIDIHANRVLVGLRSRLPVILWVTLFLLTFFSMAGVGYQEALSKSKRSPATLVLVLSFMLVIVLTIDLDRPREGLITVSQEAMLALKTMIAGAR